jgi:hypothetical protein
VDAQLELFGELFIELLPVVLVLGELVHQLHALLYKVLGDDVEDLFLLVGLTRDVGQILKVDDSAHDEVQVLGKQLLVVVHD